MRDLIDALHHRLDEERRKYSEKNDAGADDFATHREYVGRIKQTKDLKNALDEWWEAFTQREGELS